MTTHVTGQLRKLLELGPTAQPIVAGLYAWVVTVAPVGYGKHGTGGQNWAATVFASLAFVALVRGAVSEARMRQVVKVSSDSNVERSRTLTLFSFTAASLVTWICDDEALSPVRLSAARGCAGMLGWALFAYACSAPVIDVASEPARIEAGARARGRVERGDALFVGATAFLALALQLFGWSVETPERAMLVRITTVGSGILLLGGVGAFVSMRHGARQEPPLRARQKLSPSRAIPLGWVVALMLLVAAGMLYVLTD